ncbi:uncharacterized protein [Dermacentor albipictus]|uniref:uncharacterized protein n=1 Tax=Dermacentor albipictus TaxID=60249 RepID=UPI0038FCE1C2
MACQSRLSLLYGAAGPENYRHIFMPFGTCTPAGQPTQGTTLGGQPVLGARGAGLLSQTTLHISESLMDLNFCWATSPGNQGTYRNPTRLMSDKNAIEQQKSDSRIGSMC